MTLGRQSCPVMPEKNAFVPVSCCLFPRISGCQPSLQCLNRLFLSCNYR